MSGDANGPSHSVQWGEGVRVEPVAYIVTRFSNDSPNQDTWSARVEAAGFDRWAVRNGSRCLSKALTWDYEPQPSSRTDEWLDEHRWNDVSRATAAAMEAEPTIRWNGLTPADVQAREQARARAGSQ